MLDEHRAMRTRTPSLLPLLVLLSLVILSACRKEKEPRDNDLTSALDNRIAEAAFNDMLKQADDAAKDGGLRELMDPCVVELTIDTTSMPRTLLIDFGTVNCTSQDGRQRRGKILVTFTGPYRAPGTVITITPQGYHVDDYLIQGTKTVTNLGLNSNGQTHFSVVVSGTITAPNGGWTSTHQAQRVRTWIAGETTQTPWDDEYLITGSGSGVNRNGIAYTLLITQALHVKIGCWYITAGKLEITPQGKPTRYIDFGNGNCDAGFTVTVNGVTYTVG